VFDWRIFSADNNSYFFSFFVWFSPSKNIATLYKVTPDIVCIIRDTIAPSL